MYHTHTFLYCCSVCTVRKDELNSIIIIIILYLIKMKL